MEDSIGFASGEWIPDDGAWQFQGYDENGLLRSLNGRLTEMMRRWRLNMRTHLAVTSEKTSTRRTE